MDLSQGDTCLVSHITKYLTQMFKKCRFSKFHDCIQSYTHIWTSIIFIISEIHLVTIIFFSVAYSMSKKYNYIFFIWHQLVVTILCYIFITSSKLRAREENQLLIWCVGTKTFHITLLFLMYCTTLAISTPLQSFKM